MEKIKIISYIFLTMLIVIPTIYADNFLEMKVTTNKAEEVLKHGQSTKIKFTLTHENRICDIKCNWNFINVETGQILNKSSIELAPGKSLSKTFTVTAPSISESQEGTIGYMFQVSCKDIKTEICVYSGSKQESNLFMMRYALTSSQENAKAFLEANMSILEAEYEQTERRIAYLRDKIISTPKGYLIFEIRNNHIKLQNDLAAVKNRIDQISSNFNQKKYVEARNIFNEEDILELNRIEDSIEFEVDKFRVIEAKHTNTTSVIKNLQYELNNIGDENIRISTNYKRTVEKINQIASDLDNGKYNNYGQVEELIENVRFMIQNLYNQETDDEKIKQNIIAVLRNQTDDLCDKGYCIDYTDMNTNARMTSFLDNFCTEELNKINYQIQTANKALHLDYQNEIEKIKSPNKVISKINNEIITLNGIKMQLTEALDQSRLGVTDKKCLDFKSKPTTTKEEIQGMITLCNATRIEVLDEVSKRQSAFLYKFMRAFKRTFFETKYPYIPVNQLETIQEPSFPVNYTYSPELEFQVDIYC